MTNNFYDIHQKLVKRKNKDKVFWRISAYGVVLSSDQKVLLVLPCCYKDKWILPGGEIELDESIQEGIIRECYEETGYRIRVISDKPIYIGESNFYAEKKFCHSINLIYQGALLSDRPNKEVINKVCPNEVEKVEWIPLLEINEKNCHHIMYPAVKNLKNKII